MYLAGVLPIADAFIAWSNSLEATQALQEETNWRIPFQLISAMAMSGFLMVLGWLWKTELFKRNKKGKSVSLPVM